MADNENITESTGSGAAATAATAATRATTPAIITSPIDMLQIHSAVIVLTGKVDDLKSANQDDHAALRTELRERDQRIEKRMDSTDKRMDTTDANVRRVSDDLERLRNRHDEEIASLRDTSNISKGRRMVLWLFESSFIGTMITMSWKPVCAFFVRLIHGNGTPTH